MLRAFIKVAKISDLGEGEMLAVTAEGEEVEVAIRAGRISTPGAIRAIVHRRSSRRMTPTARTTQHHEPKAFDLGRS
jgi:hypothetical protein